ncbi:BTB/POZ-like protein [Corchorus olitorius]|uniref:BTB/POZ-like protein n=1 Tax=Corchorus olitorius TaxID=93759 RepID=A0A1R3FWK7_9ROSI|nr:BTB/POZ-like protein [Corchorus olitorius]
MVDSKVETISRLAQWRIDNFGPCTYKKSDPFKVGLWNWIGVCLSVFFAIEFLEQKCYLKSDCASQAWAVFENENMEQNHSPFIAKVGERDGPCLLIYLVFERPLRTCDDFIWPVDSTLLGRFIIDVEFLDMKIFPLNGGEPISIWPMDGAMESAQSTLHCLARMLHEGIHADVTINTADGTLKAHKAVLSASSAVFESMFHHDLKEKESSTIHIEDMSLESCMAFLSYLYGTIKQEDFWKHRLALLGAANKYDIVDLKDACEDSLLEDINSQNVLERLQESWLYQLNRLKKGCMTYLIDFGKIYDVRDEINNFFRHADRELMLEMFQEVLTVWKPV